MICSSERGNEGVDHDDNEPASIPPDEEYPFPGEHETGHLCYAPISDAPEYSDSTPTPPQQSHHCTDFNGLCPSSGGHSDTCDQYTLSSLSFQPSMADSSLILSGTPIEEETTASSVTNHHEISQSDVVETRALPTISYDEAIIKPPETLARHELDSFINVGHLMRSPHRDPFRVSPSPDDDCSKRDYCLRGSERIKFRDEREWDEMMKAARAALDALGHEGVLRELQRAGISIEPASNNLPAIPPSPPVEKDCSEDTVGDSNLYDDALFIPSHSLPDEFTCPLCKLLIVGASVLSCGCVYCSRCIDGQLTLRKRKVHSSTLCDDVVDGFVIVDKGEVPTCSFQTQQGDDSAASRKQDSGCCPSCDTSVHLPASSCYALDIAILTCVRNLSAESERNAEHLLKDEVNATVIYKVQSLYFGRLHKWREEVIALHTRALKDRELYEELLLGALIQAEEEKAERTRGNKRKLPSFFSDGIQCEKRGLQLLGEVAIFITVAATAAFFGRGRRERV